MTRQPLGASMHPLGFLCRLSFPLTGLEMGLFSAQLPSALLGLFHQPRSVFFVLFCFNNVIIFLTIQTKISY